MAVRTGETEGSAFLVPRLWRNGVTRAVRSLTRLPSDDRARRNAQVAAATLARARHDRKDVDRFLTAHAARDGRRSA